MTTRELASKKIELYFKLAFYTIGLTVAFVLALVNSEFAGEAFALVGGFMGGNALNKTM